MNHTKIIKILFTLFALVLYFGPVGLAGPLGTAFTYQGRLIDNNQPADGLYDLQFKLYDAASDGNKTGGDVNSSETQVNDGYFTVELDFGNVFDGNERWLQIGARPGKFEDPNLYTVLSPRQKATPTPYALYAKTARGGGGATLLVAASNAPSYIKARADYVCTGSDDQVVINEAYHALPNYTGGTLYFSAGDFNCHNTIEINDWNRPASLIGTAFLSYWPAGQFYAAGTAFHLRANKQLLNYGYRHDTGGGCNWSCGEIKYIWFDGNNLSDSNTERAWGIFIGTKGDTLIEHCMFHKFQHAYALKTSQHATWMNACDIEGSRGCLYIRSCDNWITNCQFIGNYAYADTPVLSLYGSTKMRTWIQNCYFYNNTNTRLILFGDTLSGDVFVLNNYFNGWPAAKYAIKLADDVDANVIISGNTFSGSSSNSYGIYGTGSYSAMSIKDNIFSGTQGNSIYLPGNLSNCKIKDNIGAEETLSATGTALRYETTHLSGAAASQTITVPDLNSGWSGPKIFDMTDASNPVTLSVTHHVLGNPYTYTFDDVSDYARLEWSGKAWITVVSNGL